MCYSEKEFLVVPALSPLSPLEKNSSVNPLTPGRGADLYCSLRKLLGNPEVKWRVMLREKVGKVEKVESLKMENWTAE